MVTSSTSRAPNRHHQLTNELTTTACDPVRHHYRKTQSHQLMRGRIEKNKNLSTPVTVVVDSGCLWDFLVICKPKAYPCDDVTPAAVLHWLGNGRVMTSWPFFVAQHIPLASGLRIKTEVIGAISVKITADIKFSLWHRNVEIVTTNGSVLWLALVILNIRERHKKTCSVM